MTTTLNIRTASPSPLGGDGWGEGEVSTNGSALSMHECTTNPPSPGTPGEGRGEGSAACVEQAHILGPNNRWSLALSLVLGSWTLALNLRIRTHANRNTVARS